MARVLIGTSGWHYDSWRGPFFPKGLPLKAQLQYYTSQFRTTELNGVFYRTPSLDAVKAWRTETGDDFVFAWKASKFITHWKRLSPNSVNSLALIEERLRLLAAKAGPILFQLPPNFIADAERLSAFFDLLPRRRRYSFEFPTSELVPAARPAPTVGTQHCALPFRPSRCSRSLETHRRFCLHPRSWSGRAI
jgi:uncharacterized protein YecE (DUF72 family)